MSARRYIIHPGYIISEADGDRRYVGFHDLVRLYGFRKSACIFFPTEPARQMALGHKPTDIHLFPREDGDYKIEKPKRAKR